MKRSLAISVLFLMLTATTASALTRVVYPATDSGDTRFVDLVEILKTALEKTVPEYGPYTLRPTTFLHLTEARYLDDLRDPAGEVNVVWSGTSEQKERDYCVVRIPLRKGILGYRVALIAKDRQKDIDKIKTVDDLRKMSVGQGIGWGDVAVYEANGIPVHTATYANLFRMVAAKRFDLFPRGISEAFKEYDARHSANPDLVVEKNLLIYYPWPYYFFFNKSNTALAERVETGLRKMLKDGSFDAIFLKYNRAAIQKAHLKKRRIIRLKNPSLPKATPLSDPSLWFDPEKGR